MGNCVCRRSSRTKYEVRRFCDWCDAKENSGVCICRNTVGSCLCPPNAAPSPSCVFFSPRIQALLEGNRTEEETTKDHWTGVQPTSQAEEERIGEENRKYFDEVLVNHPDWGDLFTKFVGLKLGAKIGEGGQAEIFEAQCWFNRERSGAHWVAKVWKVGVSLKDLEQQWPPEMLNKLSQQNRDWPFKNICGATFIRGGKFKNRFAFVMRRHWGDLRTLIDQRMHNLLCNYKNHGPPFRKIEDVYRLIWVISEDLCKMHEAGVLHRDIKASNILLYSPYKGAHPVVIDFECSMGVTGTGFFRAPEILEQVQKRVPCNELVFTEKADIYSFGMMCYEVITGCIPFEGYPLSDYSIVLSGERPRLPHDLNPNLQELILACWQHDPQLRPTSLEIYTKLEYLKNLSSRGIYLSMK
ncbi:hypothetical protein KC19_12G087100 [Ceratodon purpureus]|uniref:Protein kinase domain-containing protein n=1 Tax=Ceratodon purpureus TaxID=3225 RepID=A0A8T0GAS7_CERPU|nr:hypothetical protein KC19_12G087100 [Ceratodon purpureus]